MTKAKDKFSITTLILTLVGVLFISIVIVAGILLFNEKTIVVPDDFATIQGAVDDADPGDIILVKAEGGPYNEEVTIDKEKIKLIGIGKVKPVLDGTVVGGDGITLDNISDVVVKNFIVRNFSDNGIFLVDSDNNMLKGNIVMDNGNDGIDLDDSNSNMFKGNTVMDNSVDGIDLNDSNSNMIKGNTVNNNGDEGIDLEESDSNIIKGNTVNDNENDGIDLDNSNSNIIEGNTTNLNGDNDNGIELLNNSNNNTIKGNTANNNGNDGIFLSADSNDNDVFFNRAFGNVIFDIEDLDDNNFKGNKCGTSSGANVDCPN